MYKSRKQTLKINIHGKNNTILKNINQSIKHKQSILSPDGLMVCNGFNDIT